MGTLDKVTGRPKFGAFPAVVGSDHMIDFDDKGPQQLKVRARCKHKGAIPCCITHGMTFKTLEELAGHCEDKRIHATAFLCSEKLTTQTPDHDNGTMRKIETTHGLENTPE